MERIPIIVVFLTCLVIHLVMRRFFLPRLPRLAARTYTGMMIAWIVLLLAHTLLIEFNVIPVANSVRHYFNIIGAEYKPSVVFSALLFALVGFTALLNAWLAAPRVWLHRLYWVFVGGLFTFWALDEYFVFHENTSDRWILIYAALGLVYVATTFVLYRARRGRADLVIMLLMLGGIAVSVTGAVGLETFIDDLCEEIFVGYPVCEIGVLEETLENVGNMIVLAGALAYAVRYMDAPSLALAKRILFIAGTVWTLMTLLTWFPVALTLIAFVVVQLILWTQVLPRLPSAARWGYVVLMLAGALLIGLHIALNERHLVSAALEDRAYFDMLGEEHTPMAILWLLQYTLTGLTALAIAVFAAPRAWWHRLGWLLVAIIFLTLGFNEYFLFQSLYRDSWLPIFSVLAAAFFAITLLLYRRRREDVAAFVLLWVGFAMAAANSVLFQQIRAQTCVQGPLCYQDLLQESLELLGVLVALSGAVLYAARHIRLSSGSWGRRLVIAGAVAGVVFVLLGFWLRPSLEARALARPVQIDYSEAALSVVSYRVQPPVVRANDNFEVEVFLRVNNDHPSDYGLTLQLIDPDNGQSMASASIRLIDRDTLQGSLVQTLKWLPGQVHRAKIAMRVPPTLPAPHSYALTLTVWEDMEPDFSMLPVSQTDRQLMTSDLAVLGRLAVLPPVNNGPLDHPSNYRFRAGLQLVGYNLPAQTQDHKLPVTFAWNAFTNVDHGLTQFLHVVPAAGTDVFAYDRPFLGGLFPMDAWPGSIATVDAWEVALPDDLPPGEYRVYTGVYDSQTLERERVIGDDDQPVPDFSIFIGTVLVD